MKFLIDCDVIVYRCGAVTENEPIQNCLQTVKTTLNGIFENSGFVDPGGTYTWRAFLGSTDKSNFRYNVAVTEAYKGNRTAPRPRHYDAIREYLVKNWNAEIIHGQESDDALGIAQCTAPPGTTVICSNDKDLNMIPGHHYNFVKRTAYWVTEEEAIKNFYTQVLTGDSSDNIPGLWMIGPKKAEKILAGCVTEDELYNACLEAYEGNETFMHEMCSLLWIRRKENEVWKPPMERDFEEASANDVCKHLEHQEFKDRLLQNPEIKAEYDRLKDIDIDDLEEYN